MVLAPNMQFVAYIFLYWHHTHARCHDQQTDTQIDRLSWRTALWCSAARHLFACARRSQYIFGWASPTAHAASRRLCAAHTHCGVKLMPTWIWGAYLRCVQKTISESYVWIVRHHEHLNYTQRLHYMRKWNSGINHRSNTQRGRFGFFFWARKVYMTYIYDEPNILQTPFDANSQSFRANFSSINLMAQ